MNEPVQPVSSLTGAPTWPASKRDRERAAIERSLADLELARVATIDAMTHKYACPVDRLKGAGELRLIAKEHVSLTDRLAKLDPDEPFLVTFGDR